jgi:capsular polysaccharide transport system ATP-binding protein
MIRIDSVTKSYPVGGRPHIVLDDISAEFRDGESVGFLGRNGAGKSTLLRIIAGIEPPDVGTIERRAKVSWPIGFGGGFNGTLSGEENCRFAARIYNEDVDAVTAFAFEFSELDKFFFMPVRTYSSGMRARLAFGLSMAIDFDYYLVDEVTSVGDAHFRHKCKQAFAAMQERASVLMVSHSTGTIAEYCSRYTVLKDGKLCFYDTIAEAARVYEGK